MNNSIAANFSKQARTYDQFAHMQCLASKRLVARLLESHINTNEELGSSANILEIGCGTGILSSELIDLFNSLAEMQFFFLDPAAGMLDLCQQKLQGKKPNSLHFIKDTIEGYLDDKKWLGVRYSLIISSFALHWLNDLQSILKQLMSRLKKNGYLIFAIPIAGSFPEWERVCNELNIPFTANRLPAADEIREFVESSKAFSVMEEYTHQVEFDDALHFFQEMKMLGANTRTINLSTADAEPSNNFDVNAFRALIKLWNSRKPVKCTYRVMEVTMANR